MVTARPYPFDVFEKVSRAQVMALRRCARRIPILDADRAAQTAAHLLGERLNIRPLPPSYCSEGQLGGALGDTVVALILEPAAGETGRIAVEISDALAANVVDRALGGSEGESAPVSKGTLGDTERGVLAYVAARLLAEAGEQPWRLVAVVTTAGGVVAHLGDEGCVTWPAEVSLGQTRGVVRALLPRRVIASLGEATAAARAAGSVATLELTVVAEAARGRIAARELRGLRIGDVVMPDEVWVSHGGQRPVHGQVRLRIEGAARTAWHCSIGDGVLEVLRVERSHEPPAGKGKRMEGDEGTGERIAETAGDAPVELVVELARFRMSLEELLALRAGEVITTGRSIGERVTLRAGDRAIATGELVDVEGEVGVRLLRIGD